MDDVHTPSCELFKCTAAVLHFFRGQTHLQYVFRCFMFYLN